MAQITQIKIGYTLRQDVFVKDEEVFCFENIISVYILNHPQPNYRIMELSENYAICRILTLAPHNITAIPRNQIICKDTWDLLRIESKDRTERFQENWNRLFAANYPQLLMKDKRDHEDQTA